MDSDKLDCEINRASAALPMEPALLTARSFLRSAPASHYPSAKPMSLNRLFVLQILRVQAYNEREKRVMPLKGGLHHG